MKALASGLYSRESPVHLMALVRFIVGLLGLALLVLGTVYGILGFWGVSRGADDGWRLALMGIGAVILGGIFLIRPPRR